MRREDIMVEVRDRNLVRRGQITTKYLKLSAHVRHNLTGDWKLTLPGAHPMVPYLSQPGAGIVVSQRTAFSPWATLFSGPVSLPSRERNREHPDGTYTFEGRTDGQLLDDARAYPTPTVADPGAQTTANDVRTQVAETLMRSYVNANIGPSAPAGRKTGSLREFIRLTQADLTRGPVMTKSPRFQILSELLNEIGTYANLGFQLVQRGSLIEFEVRNVADRSAFVRFDIANGTLTSEQVQVSPPAVTRSIVAGQGEGVERTIIQRTTTASSAAELSWGRIIERFIDQRDTDDLVELQQSGDEALIAEGFEATNVKVVPADDTTMLFGRDWNVGDIVTVVVNGQETKTTVTEAVIVLDSETVAVGAAIGDVRGFDANDALTKRVEDTERRVEKIERSVEVQGADQLQALLDRLNPIGEVKPLASFTLPAGHVLADGAAYSRATYAAAFAALNRSKGAVTVTIAAPGVFTLNAHGMSNGQRVWLASTGALPTGLAQNTTYYVVNGATNTFQLSATPGGAAITTSGTQSGVHTLWESFAGVTSSTTFLVPDLRGRTLVGRDGTQEEFNGFGETGGAKTHTLSVAELPAHSHPLKDGSHSVSWGTPVGTVWFDNSLAYAGAPPGNQETVKQGSWNATSDTGSGSAHNNLQPYSTVQYIIRME